jgi:Brp/Blh family beta-carotene 15,15'-monooxygenase
MFGSEQRLLTHLRAFSRVSLFIGAFISLPIQFLFPNQTSWQVVLAIVALAIGIPHGAMDHTVTVPKMASPTMLVFVVGYLAVTAVAIWFILSQNVLGFQLVVLMSALHFGFGDAAFLAELDARGAKRGFPKVLYALAAGFTPVGIPLVNSQSQQALALVNPNLIGWATGLAPTLFAAFVILNLTATAILFGRGHRSQALDLVLLLTLAVLAPPLVAFAFYFGFWHALRHTGRLSLELQTSTAAHKSNQPSRAFWLTVLPGLPALALVIVSASIMVALNGLNFKADFLWYLLVVIWALTVPHMVLTTRLDLRALGLTATLRNGT